MAEVEVNHTSHQQFDSQNISCKVEGTDAVAPHSHEPNGECRLTEESINHDNLTELLKKGFMEYGYDLPFFHSNSRFSYFFPG